MSSPSVVQLILLLLTLVTLAFADTTQSQVVNSRPIIGVFACPPPIRFQKTATSYIPASYVKWLESSGARVVPVPYDLPLADLQTLLRSISGLLLPGGYGEPTVNPDTPYMATLRHVLAYAHETNRVGRPFAIYGTCLGFEALSVLTADDNILINTNAENMTGQLTDVAMGGSRLFGGIQGPLAVQLLKEKPIATNFHSYGLGLGTMNTRPFLQTRLLATQPDLDGLPFVAAWEHAHYPIFASQFHPERPAFEWDPAVMATPHTVEAVIVGQAIGNSFVEQARQSYNKFPNTDQEDAMLIYNFPVTYTESDDFHFEQAYFFSSDDVALRINAFR